MRSMIRSTALSSGADDLMTPSATRGVGNQTRRPAPARPSVYLPLTPLRRYRLRWRQRSQLRLLQRGDRARDAGDCGAAASFYRRALAFDVSRADIRVQLAHMLKALTCYGEAEAAYRQALAQVPEDSDTHLQLGHLLKLLGRTDEAIAAYSAAHRLSDGADTAVAELSALGALPVGVEDRQARALAAERQIAEGDRLRDEGRSDAAADAYSRALELAPSRSDIRVQYGNMLKDTGRLAEAEAAYQLALADASESGEIHLQLGHVFKLQGRPDAALAAYRRAADLQPSLEAALAELAHAGCPASQQQHFDAQIVRGGVEALLAVGEEVTRLQSAVARLSQSLPDLCGQVAFPVASYERYRSLFDVPAPPPREGGLRFAIVLTAAGVPLETLYEQIASLTHQSYLDWQLIVVGSDDAQQRVTERAAASDARIAWVPIVGNEASAAAERRVALASAADWLVLPAPEARLHPLALAWCAAAIGQGPAVAFITDEEAVAERDGTRGRLAPQFRQAVDYDTLLETNPYGETIVVERTAYTATAGSVLTQSASVARSSLLLALARDRVVGHLPLPLVAAKARNGARRAAAAGAHRAAVRAHLAGSGLADRAVPGTPAEAAAPLPIAWQPRRPTQTIEVIIPTRDNGADLRDLVQSLRRHAAVPEALRVLIVDNGSERSDTRRILGELGGEDWASVVTMDEPFNWSRLNCRAAAMSHAELLVFANDDMLMLTDGWDRQLRGLLERPEIGAVGARLVYPDDTIQHAGILLGWPNIDVHDGRFEPMSQPGPGGRWHVTRAVSAVTGAFLAVRREAFEASGGFDEAGLPVAYADIDFALRLRARGLKILWTPSITLRHYESKSRGLDHLDPERRARNDAERRVIEQRWGAALHVDPSVNPAWHAATLPFRLISAPSQQRLWRHIRLCASADPWLPEGQPQPDVPPLPAG